MTISVHKPSSDLFSETLSIPCATGLHIWRWGRNARAIPLSAQCPSNAFVPEQSNTTPNHSPTAHHHCWPPLSWYHYTLVFIHHYSALDAWPSLATSLAKTNPFTNHLSTIHHPVVHHSSPLLAIAIHSPTVSQPHQPTTNHGPLHPWGPVETSRRKQSLCARARRRELRICWS